MNNNTASAKIAEKITLKESTVSSNSLSNHIDVIEKKLTNMKLNFSSLQAEEQALQTLADNMSLLASSDDDLMVRYQENLSAFEEYHPEIFEFFKNYVPAKYIVDASDGFVNAIDVNTGEAFYKYPSFLVTKLQFDKFLQSPNIKKFNFDGEEENEAKFIHVDSVDAMVALLPKKNSNQNNRSQEIIVAR